MSTTSEPKPEQNSSQAAEQVASAHRILKELQQKLGNHPELGEAITKLEMALSTLAVKTGGLLWGKDVRRDAVHLRSRPAKISSSPLLAPA